jgi:hypothetical protein
MRGVYRKGDRGEAVTRLVLRAPVNAGINPSIRNGGAL